MENGQRTRSIYLPKGADWIDGWSGTSYSGGSAIEIDAPLDQIPAFIRKGSNLPLFTAE